MENIAANLAFEDILLDVDAADSRALFAAVSESLQAHHGIDGAQVSTALAAREALGSTGIGVGVAIPHARVAGLLAARAALVRLRTAIDFDAPDAEKVSLFFLMLVPESADEHHLDLLAQFATLAVDAKLREELQRTSDVQRIHDLISGTAQQPMLKAA